MPHIFTRRLISVVLLLTTMLLYSGYPVLASEIHSRCYRATTAKPSPRTCDSKSKNCKVPIAVSADHKPDMNLCFQGIDATYEVYPISASSRAEPVTQSRKCRPLKPSKTVTTIDDKCFHDLVDRAKDAVKASGVKAHGTYTMCSAIAINEPICVYGADDGRYEENCNEGLHSVVGLCYSVTAPGQCHDAMEVGSYYCPEKNTYTAQEIHNTSFTYNFEVKKTLLYSASPEVTSSLIATTSFVNLSHPYIGWTYIVEVNDSETDTYQSFVRSNPIEIGDCSDYCAMVQTNNIFHTSKQCYTESENVCEWDRQVIWQEFDPSRDKDVLTLPYTSAEGGTINKDGTYTTTNIASFFTYTAIIDLDAAHADPDITASCATISTAADLEAGILQAQTYAQHSLLYVKRVCDQVVLSLYDCVLRYSHHDGSAMYWTVEARGNISDCTVYAVDDNSVIDLILPVTPMTDHAHGSESTKIPIWVIAVIVIAAVVVIAIVLSIALLSTCACCPLMGLFHREPQNKKDPRHNNAHNVCFEDGKMNADGSRTSLRVLQGSAINQKTEGDYSDYKTV